MKKIFFVTWIGGLLISMTGCKKWLEVSSKTDVVEKDMFADEQGFMDAMAGVYFTMASDSLYGDVLTMGLMDVLAHRYNFDSYFYSDYSEGLTTSSYFVRDVIRQKVSDIWKTGYNAIANANNLLANIDAHKGVFHPGNYELIKGEALGVRAFMHFDLLRMFGASYLTGKDKPAIPYVTEFTGKKVTPLSTVAAVTDSVLTDLNAALALLKDDDLHNSSVENPWVNNRKCHFSKLAAEALMARVYLYRGDKVNALLHANTVINSNALHFVNEVNLQKPNFDYTFSTEQVFALSKFNLDVLYNKYFTGSNYGFQLTNDCGKGSGSIGSVERIYETSSGGSTDFRYMYLWTSYNWSYYCPKYNQSNVVERNLMPLIRLPEMYYIAAECSTPAVGAGLLNIVRKARGISGISTQLDADQFQFQVFKEYQKEFYLEGQLWYYYKRLNMPQLMEYNGESFIPNAPGYVFPLPDDEVLLGGR